MAFDTIVTVFESRGVIGVVGAFRRLEAAQERAAQAQLRYNAVVTSGNANQQRSAWNALRSSQQVAEERTRELLQRSLQGMQTLITAIRSATDSYAEMAKAIQDVQMLTGSGLKQAAGFSLMAHGAGVQDTQEIKDILHLGSAVFDEKGRTALGRLGVAASPNMNGLDILEKTLAALDRYPDGLRKAQIAQEIFGAKGVRAMLPLIRMTKETRDAYFELGQRIEGRTVRAMQLFEEKAGLAKQAFLVNIVGPIVERTLPAFMLLTNVITKVTDLFYKLDQITGGASTWILLGTIVGVTLVGAFVALTTAISASATAMAILDGLTGNLPALAAGLAAGAAVGAVGFGLSKWAAGEEKAKQQGDSADKFAGAVDKFQDGVSAYVDGLRFNRGGIPRGLGPQDVNVLADKLALGVIG